jgi:probable rRNA maturation factor
MFVNIISDTNRRIPRKRILELIALIEEEEDPPDSIVNIVFVTDTHIASLNKKFRKISKPTDVLSFNLDDKQGKDSIFGEIYISTDTGARIAEKLGITFRDEMLRLCCHGFLHLLGYDHEKPKDRVIMQERERYFLGNIN